MNCKLTNQGVSRDKKTRVVKNSFGIDDLSLDAYFLDNGKEDFLLFPTHFVSPNSEVETKINTSIAFEAILRSMSRQLNENRKDFIKRSKNNKISIYFGGEGEPLFNNELIFAIANLENIFKELGYEEIKFNVLTKLNEMSENAKYFNRFYYDAKNSKNEVKLLINSDFKMEFDDSNTFKIYDLQRDEVKSWDDVFMEIAVSISGRSKDPSTQVGACIVSDKNIIISLGYNGTPDNYDDDIFPWGRDSKNPLENKYLYVVHAERNSIAHSGGRTLEGAKIYVHLFPCNECAKEIVQFGIKEVIYVSDKYAENEDVIASKIILEASGVTYRQYIPNQKPKTLSL